MTKDQIEEVNRAVVESVLYALREDAKTPLAVLKRIAVNTAKASAAGFAAVDAAATSDSQQKNRNCQACGEVKHDQSTLTDVVASLVCVNQACSSASEATPLPVPAELFATAPAFDSQLSEPSA